MSKLETNQRKDRRLLSAVKLGNVFSVNTLLQEGVDPNAYSADGLTSLHLASLAEGSRNVYGNTPSHIYVEIATLLLNAGADVNAKSKRHHGSSTALEMAIMGDNVAMLDILLKYGANVNPEDGQMPPLIFAVKNGSNAGIVEMLLNNGADVNSKENVADLTALHVAVMMKKIKIMESLLSRQGIQVNNADSKGYTPLHYATASGRRYFDVISSLLERGADVNGKDYEGNTPLHLAVSSGNREKEELSFFLKSGAEVNLKNHKGNTPLHLLASSGNFVKLSYLLKSGAEVNLKNYEGNTPLHLAAISGNVEVLSYLLKFGAKVNLINCKGNTPLHILASSRNFVKLSYLLKSDTKVNLINCKGNTPLHLAASSGNIEMLSYLLNSGAKVNLKNEYGESPLCLAFKRIPVSISSFNDDIIRKLLSYGADANICIDKFPETLHQEIPKWQRICKDERARLKNASVSNSHLSLYDFVTENPNILARRAQDESVTSFLRSQNNYEAYWVYGDLLQHRCQMVLERNSLLSDTVVWRMQICLGLPNLCIYEICDYLSNEDLRNFIEACKDGETCIWGV